MKRSSYLDALVQRSAELQRGSLELIDRSTRTQNAARAALHDARLARVTTLVVRGGFPPGWTSPKNLLVAALDAALDAAKTRLGNVQLVEPNGVLRIYAQRGFAAPFLEFFEEVRPGLQSACGAALMSGRQVVVRDVQAHHLFRGKVVDVLREARVAAVVSSPIVDARGDLRGVLSVHHSVPGARSVTELRKLHFIARRAGLMLGERVAA